MPKHKPPTKPCPRCKADMSIYAFDRYDGPYFELRCYPCRTKRDRERDRTNRRVMSITAQRLAHQRKWHALQRELRANDPLDHVEGPVRPWREEEDRTWMRAIALKLEALRAIVPPSARRSQAQRLRWRDAKREQRA